MFIFNDFIDPQRITTSQSVGISPHDVADQIARVYEGINNARKDFHFKTAHHLCDGHGMVFTEDLNLMRKIQGVKNNLMRILHTMLRVGNLDESIKFYCDVLGMKLLRKKDYPGGEFTLAFVGYGDESDHSVIELTYNWGTDKYDLGNAYGHIAIGVNDIYGTCAQIRLCGCKIVREPGPMKHGSTVIAFIEDPDGYKIELIQLATQGSGKKEETAGAASI